MVAFHVPGKSRRSDSVKSVIGGMGGIFMLTLTVVRGLG